MGDNKRIAINSLIILIRLVVTTIAGLITARYVIQALGASDYGLYNVVGGIVALLNILNASMTTSTYRFLAFELGKGDDGDPNQIFSSSFLIHTILSLLIFIVGGVIGLWYINNYLNISNGNVDAALFVFWISLLTTVISTLIVPFQGLLVAYEKFSYIALIDIITRIIILLVIIFLSNKEQLHIKTYSLVMLANAMLCAALYLFYAYHKYLLIVKLKLVRQWSVYKELLSFTLWTLFGGIGNIGQSQGSAMLVNFFFGTVVNAPYAIANQIKSFVNSFSTTLCQAAVPQITKEYSSGNIQQAVNITCNMSKYTFLLMLLPVFPLFMEMDFVLELWLKDVPSETAIFSKLTLLEGLIWCLGAGIPSLINATGRIKNYQIVAYTLLFLGLPVSFAFYKLGYEAYIICIVYCALTLLISFVKLYFVKQLLNVDIAVFFKRSYIRIVLVSIPLILLYALYDSSSFTIIGHIIGLICSEFVLIIVIYLIGLDAQEHKLVIGYVKNKFINKLRNKNG